MKRSYCENSYKDQLTDTKKCLMQIVKLGSIKNIIINSEIMTLLKI